MDFKILLSMMFLGLLLFLFLLWFSPVDIYSTIAFGVNPKMYGMECDYGGACGNLVVVSCQPEVDGPLYYVDKKTRHVVEYCGGFCMIANANYCKNCPPKEWTCK